MTPHNYGAHKSVFNASWPGYLIFFSLLAVLILSTQNPLSITHVVVDHPATPATPGTFDALPYSRSSETAPATFHVKADIWYTVLSASRIRIAPDDCLEAMTINGVDVPEVKSTPTSLRCWPSSYIIDLRQYLHPGVNVAELELTNKGGSYGIDMGGRYPQSTVLAMVACAGLALYAGTFALLKAVPELRAFFSSVYGWLCVVFFLPCLGLFAMWATIANKQGEAWSNDYIVPTLVAIIIPFALLLRLFDKSGGRPLRLPRSYPAAAVSLAAFAYASRLLDDRGWSSYGILGIASIGVVAGVFACVPFRPFAERLKHYPGAGAVVIIAALCPHAYWNLRLPGWVQSSDVTVAMVRGILWICGYPTTTSVWEQKDKDGRLSEYWVSLSSSDFSVRIASWCSGLEGGLLFIFLFSIFVLLDWPVFSRVKHLWAVYLVTIPLVLVVNAMRIAGIFLYAEWYVWRYNRKAANWAVVEAFHSNIGWVIYSVAFAVFLPLVYRWASRAAKVK